MNKEQIIKWLDEGYYVPVELRGGERCIVDPLGRMVGNSGDYQWLDENEIDKLDIVKVFKPFKQDYDKPIWQEDSTEELKAQLAEKERELRKIADEMKEIKEKMK
jgi:hypothetical protein